MSEAGGVTLISGAIDVPPAPQYEDEAAEALGEKLAELYARREQNPRAKIDDLIEATRRELRRGPRLRAGEFLKDGRYRLLERLGESPSETTWKCWDRDHQKLVVVKEMVGPWVAQKMRVGAFLEAARNLSELEHAGMARVLEATQSRDGFVYLATDYFDQGRLDSFKGDAIDVLQVVVEVANALQAAHGKDIVHARITPQSIYFDPHGGARLVDFDLAGETIAQESGSIYVAPEMVEKGSRATPASDVYALAMCAMYALNGNKLPYTVVRGPERVINALKVFDSVKDVLKRAVDWDVAVRFPTMAELNAAIVADAAVLEALAERAWDRKRYVIASEHYTALWTLKPQESVRIKTRLAEIYLAMEAWEEAYSCIAGAVAEADDVEPLYSLFHRYAAGTNDWKRVADTLWNEARDRSPLRRSSMRAELATITEERLGDQQGAAEIWTLVLQDHRLPSSGEQALRALRRLAEARQDWAAYVEHAQELLPHLGSEEASQTQYGIGRAMVKELGQEEQGLEWIDRAELAGIQPLDMATQLQEIRARRGQWRRVIKLMRLEADNERKVHAASRILLRAATIARAVHLDDEAEAIYENMLERAPQHYPALRDLARMRHRSGRRELAMDAYETLTKNHYVGKSEEPEASERAADHTAYAELLVDEGRFEEALVQLEAALTLQPDNIEALRLAGPLFLDTGALEQGAQVLEKLYTLFKAVNSRGARLEAALQRADAAWFRGRLAVAMRWYNTALDTVPDSAEAWWGLAKIAIAARGGHPGGDRAPWLVNIPECYTPQEGLARLLMGLFGVEAMSEWLSLHPLGKGVVDGGATHGRLACAGVDLLARYHLIRPDLFERLREAYPDWQRRIDAVEGLFTSSAPPDFNIGRSYRWARTALENDFDSEERKVLTAGEPVQGILVVDFDADEHWQVLLSSPQPEEPPAPLPQQTAGASDSETPATVEFVLGDKVEFTLKSNMNHATIGSKKGQSWKMRGLEPQHAVVRRVGECVYVERVGQAEMSVEGMNVEGWRLMGGETLQLGSHLYDVRVRAGEVDAQILPDDDTAGPSEDDSEVTQAARPAMLMEIPQDEHSEDLHAPEEETQSGTFEEVFDAVTPAAPEPSLLVAADEEDSFVFESTDGETDDEAPTDQAIEPPDDEPVVDEPEAEEPIVDEPIVDEPVVDEPVVDEPVVDEGDPEFEDDPVPEPTLPPLKLRRGDSDEVTMPGHTGMLNLADLVRNLDARSLPVEPTVEEDFPEEPDPSVEVPMDPEEHEPTEFPDPDVSEDPTALDVPQRPERPLPAPVSDLDDEDEFGSDVGWGEEEATVIQRSPLSSDDEALDSLGPAGEAPVPANFLGGDDLDATMPAMTLPAGVLNPPAFALQGGGGGWDDDSKAFDRPTPPESVHDEPPEPEVDAFLEVMSGPSRGTQVSVSGVVTLGRDESCDLCIPGDSMLAPLHCRLIERDGTFLILDNATDRGTVVNGTRVTEAILMGGETIMAGVTVLRFQIHG